MQKHVQYKMPSGEMVKFYTEKGIVKSAELCRPSDKPYLTIHVGVDFGDSFQGAFGGTVLGGMDDKDAETSKTTLDIVKRINELFNTENLGDISGKKVTIIQRTNDDSIMGLQSEDGFTFFIDHWRVDHFKNTIGSLNCKKIEANTPIRNERGKTYSSIGNINRLDVVK